jgi:hypothetical protein
VNYKEFFVAAGWFPHGPFRRSSALRASNMAVYLQTFSSLACASVTFTEWLRCVGSKTVTETLLGFTPSARQFQNHFQNQLPSHFSHHFFGSFFALRLKRRVA